LACAEVGVVISVVSEEVDLTVVLLRSSHSSSSRPARSTSAFSYRASPYTTPKREVKEEPIDI
jgi:hypothetical protein